MVEEGNQGVGMRGISCKKREVKIGWRMNWEWQQGKRAGKQGAKSSSRQCKSPEGTGSRSSDPRRALHCLQQVFKKLCGTKHLLLLNPVRNSAACKINFMQSEKRLALSQPSS